METKRVKKVFEGNVLELFRNEFLYPDGTEVSREIVAKDNAVAVVAYDGEGIILVSQPREPVGSDNFLELPAGTMDVPGESALKCAKRELQEETGYLASEWEHLTSFYSTPGCMTEQIILFAATGLVLDPNGPSPTEQERIKVVKYGWDEIEEMINIGQISDAKTIAGLLWVIDRDRKVVLDYIKNNLE